jgi:SAM-dependent methyltransferase
MGRWLHFAKAAGAEIVGMDVSPAIDVAAARDGDGADFVQADLRWPPFPPQSFDLVYSLGVLHHLEDPRIGVRALAGLVRPGGELRLYVYRTLDDEPWWKRILLHMVTGLRQITTRLPYPAVHGVAWLVAAVASVLFLAPRRLLRRSSWGDRLTRGLPLVHYADVPFRMVVSEQFDRLVAPIEGRFRREDVEAWLRDVGFEVVAVLPGLGWRAIGRRPVAGSHAQAPGARAVATPA